MSDTVTLAGYLSEIEVVDDLHRYASLEFERHDNRLERRHGDVTLTIETPSEVRRHRDDPVTSNSSWEVQLTSIFRTESGEAHYQKTYKGDPLSAVFRNMVFEIATPALRGHSELNP